MIKVQVNYILILSEVIQVLAAADNMSKALFVILLYLLRQAQVLTLREDSWLLELFWSWPAANRSLLRNRTRSFHFSKKGYSLIVLLVSNIVQGGGGKKHEGSTPSTSQERIRSFNILSGKKLQADRSVQRAFHFVFLFHCTSPKGKADITIVAPFLLLSTRGSLVKLWCKGTVSHRPEGVQRDYFLYNTVHPRAAVPPATDTTPLPAFTPRGRGEEDLCQRRQTCLHVASHSSRGRLYRTALTP